MLIHRRMCRTDFRTWCTEALEPAGHKPAAHHLLLIRNLEAVVSGEIDRLIVLMPPGSAKSTYTSKLLPAWAMAARPGIDILGASHTATLAEDFSRDVQRYIRDNDAVLGYNLASERADNWRSSNDSTYIAAGVGGPIVGRRVDLAIIDDPVKSRKEADSETYREATWKWFHGDLSRRLRPGGGIIILHTRWHEDDLAGRLLATQPDRWRVVTLHAEAMENDPLGRAPGEFLWSDDEYGYGKQLAQTKADLESTGSMREWASQFQQNPRPPEGALFKAGKILRQSVVPIGKTVRAWDLASTRQMGTNNPDWTCGVKLTRTADDRFVVVDIVRMRGGPDEVEAAIVETAKADGYNVTVGLPIDPGQSSRTQILYYTRKLIGRKVESSSEDGNKAERASPVASQVNVGNFSMVEAPWNAAFIDEIGAFPSGAKKDQVDALSRAFMMLDNSSRSDIWSRLAQKKTPIAGVAS